MPRNAKCRRVCALPQCDLFMSAGCSRYVTITVEELEAIRLCDREELAQDEAAQRMNVSRGTFQRILYSARKAVATALCEGEGIRIAGGNYVLAEGDCGCGQRCAECRFGAPGDRTKEKSREMNEIKE